MSLRNLGMLESMLMELLKIYTGQSSTLLPLEKLAFPETVMRAPVFVTAGERV